jgi:hypothetical protein
MKGKKWQGKRKSKALTSDLSRLSPHISLNENRFLEH